MTGEMRDQRKKEAKMVKIQITILLLLYSFHQTVIYTWFLDNCQFEFNTHFAD